MTILYLSSCTPGVGRDPVFPDAAVYPDAAPADASPFPDAAIDAGLRDSAVGLPDAEILPEYPFTGIFSILNTADQLYAREYEGKLNLVVRDWPYVYSGTIDEDGTVDTESIELTVAGCSVATITGEYDRPSATFILEHRTCTSGGQAINSQIQGGFFLDYDPGGSGVYELAAFVQAPNNCFNGAIGPHTVYYAINYIGPAAVTVFTAHDFLPEPAFYSGVPGSDYSFSAVQRLNISPMPVEAAISGQLMQATSNDPLRFTGVRDVFDRAQGCFFTITLEGVRVVDP